MAVDKGRRETAKLGADRGKKLSSDVVDVVAAQLSAGVGIQGDGSPEIQH
jgi:hypothetical protein